LHCLGVQLWIAGNQVVDVLAQGFGLAVAKQTLGAGSAGDSQTAVVRDDRRRVVTMIIS
jgi:hypothetical protein